MAKQIIHLDETTLKSIIRETLNEMAMSDFQTVDSYIPNLKHTNRAFLPGDILCRSLQKSAKDEDGNFMRSANGRIQQKRISTFNTIKDVDGDKLILDNGDVVGVQSPSIRTTDTWFKIFQARGHVDATGLTFDYVNEDGQIWVTVEDRSIAGAHRTLTRYKYEDVKNCTEGQPLRGQRANADIALEKSGFWLKEGGVAVMKSMNPIAGTLPIPKSFVCLKTMGGMASSARTFDAWDINMKDEITEEFPWLKTTPAFWAVPKEKGGLKYTTQQTKQKCVPDDYKF